MKTVGKLDRVLERSDHRFRHRVLRATIASPIIIYTSKSPALFKVELHDDYALNMSYSFEENATVLNDYYYYDYR